MTISFEFASARSLFEDNPVLRLWRDNSINRREYAGASWTARGVDPSSAHVAATHQIVERIESSFPTYSFWLLACNSVWNPDNRITRYKGFWRLLKGASGIEMPHGEICAEGEIKDNGKLRFFSGVLLVKSIDVVVSALKVVHEEPASSIVSVPPECNNSLVRLVERGWKAPAFLRPSLEIVDEVAGHKGIVLQPVGAFDDLEAGMVAISTRDVIERISP